MFFNLTRVKKSQKNNAELSSIKAMLDQTWNLSRQFGVEGEATEAVRIFNTFFKKLGGIVTTILKNVVALASLAPSMFEFSQSFKEKAAEQENKIADIAKAGNTMAEQIAKIADNAQRVAKDSEDIQTEVRHAKELGESSMDRFAKIKGHVDGLVSTIAVLDENSRSIGDIIDVINDISDETNVLSLNARIEAARSHVDGKGFKVIAEEIASLAKQSKDATQDIQKRLTVLGLKVNETVAAVKMVEDNVISGENLITDANTSLNKVHDHFGRLAANLAMIQDATALQNAGVTQVAEDIQEIETSVRSQSKGVETIVKNASQINGICDKMILDAGIFHLSGHDKARSSGEALAGHTDILSFDRDLQQKAMADCMKDNRFIELAYITDEKGRQVVDNIYADHVPDRENLDKGLGRDWSVKEWFRKPAASHKTFVSNVYRSSATHHFCFTIAVPLMKDRNFCGVLGIDIHFTDILDI